MHDDFIFPGDIAFRLWGTFPLPKDRLLLFEFNDAQKNSSALSRVAKRKLDQDDKEIDRESDETSSRYSS